VPRLFDALDRVTPGTVAQLVAVPVSAALSQGTREKQACGNLDSFATEQYGFIAAIQ
jgi:hypothetical protein